MELKELKDSLNSRVNEMGYFTARLFKNEDDWYYRRSFDDLFKYYRKYKVTEKLLLQALYECGFSAAVCRDIEKVVFFKYYKQDNTFWAEPNMFGYSGSKTTHNTKYTADYLDNLFKTIY